MQKITIIAQIGKNSETGCFEGSMTCQLLTFLTCAWAQDPEIANGVGGGLGEKQADKKNSKSAQTSKISAEVAGHTSKVAAAVAGQGGKNCRYTAKKNFSGGRKAEKQFFVVTLTASLMTPRGRITAIGQIGGGG